MSLLKRVVYWGWLRMVLGAIQMTCSVSAIFALFRVGFEPVTYALIGGAFGATALSRFLYRGRPDPKVQQDNSPTSQNR